MTKPNEVVRRPTPRPTFVQVPPTSQLRSLSILWSSTWSNWGSPMDPPPPGAERPFAWVSDPTLRDALEAQKQWTSRLRPTLEALYQRAGKSREAISCAYAVADFWETTVRRRSRLAEVREHLKAEVR